MSSVFELRPGGFEGSNRCADELPTRRILSSALCGGRWGLGRDRGLVVLQLAVEGLTVDTQDRRRLACVARHRRENTADVVLLELIERESARQRFVASEVGGLSPGNFCRQIDA